jgi:glycerol-3-phosphate acyltransferase PlsY
MSNDSNSNEAPAGENAGAARPRLPRRDRLPLPGMAAISLYLLVLSGVIILGVVAGHHYPPLFLFFAACFIAAGAGLLLLLRWAWALALGAAFLLTVYDLWIFSGQEELPALVQGLLNLVFFLYLVRTEVRGKLR